ncbi:kinase-like domain-containing protein [Boletus edulis]|nr:kinase-like domain-containing protein [Boletus edulis]
MSHELHSEQDIPHRIDGRYRVERRLGSGSFATVYKAVNIINRRNYAIKLEPLTDQTSQSSVEREADILKRLSQGTPVGIPRVHWFGRESNFDVLVLDLLGPSLQDLISIRTKFSALTIQFIGEQLLSRLQYIHSQGYIHGDVQPQNILTGVDHHTIFLVDFGLSRPYCHLATGKHLPFRYKCGLNGTPAFTSINSHLGAEPGRRDDLESLVYVLIYLLSGTLPWLKVTRRKKPNLSAVLKHKCTTAVEQLCDEYQFPELSSMLLYARMLSFSETPNYEYLCSLLRTALPQPVDEARSIQHLLTIEEDLHTDPLPSTCKEVLPYQHLVYVPRPVKEFCTINKGIECNFARAALYRLCAKDAVPPGTVALISAGIKCVLHAISKHGNIQDLGKLYESVQAQEYEYFHDMIGKVLEDRKGGHIFEDQLEKWARKTRCGLERVLKQSGDDNEPPSPSPERHPSPLRIASPALPPTVEHMDSSTPMSSPLPWIHLLPSAHHYFQYLPDCFASPESIQLYQECQHELARENWRLGRPSNFLPTAEQDLSPSPSLSFIVPDEEEPSFYFTI